MIHTCFGLNPLVVIVITIVLTIAAIYFVLVSNQAKRTGVYLAFVFIGVTLVSILFFKCWSLIVALLELIIGLLMHRDKFKVLRVVH